MRAFLLPLALSLALISSVQARGPYDPENVTVPPPVGPPRPVPTLNPNTMGSGFRTAYLEPKKPLYQKMAALMRQAHMLEIVAEYLNGRFRLPRPVTLVLAEGGQVNAFYNPKNHTIVLTYELIEDFFQRYQRLTPKNVSQGVTGAVMFTLLHEVGHALIHELNLPSTGREEDAVDEFATLLLAGFGQAGEEAVLYASRWFADLSRNDKHLPMWDEHALNQQRFYETVVLLYGSNPTRYDRLAKSLGLPARRLALAQEEYRKKSAAWAQLLAPYQR